ncbi:MAG: HlyD family efflux transporter periplasmic adaptor subunit [Kiritimatiellaeota bacterium]|nr:HlyD family efflux transporter periplasmic adaptor subunit [Kiritimatiellota bacterium]
MSRWGNFGRWMARFALGLTLLGVGGGGFYWQLRTAKRAGRAQPAKEVVPVAVFTARATDRTVVVRATGQVVPSRRLELTPQVAGRVIEVAPNLEPGGLFRKGDVLVRLEPDDFAAVVTQAEARLADAQAALRLEQGRQRVSRREWEELPPDDRQGGVDEDLMLRRPQLRRSEAAVKAAESVLAQARRNLERTVIRAPFDVTVLDKFVEIGQQVSPQTRLVSLAGTARWWVEAAVPLDDLTQVELPDADGNGGAAARITRRSQGRSLINRRGRVVRLSRDLSPAGRLARLLVEISDPLRLEGAGRAAAASGTDTSKGPAAATPLPLLLNDYVEVAITGRVMRNIIALPRPTVREGNKVWIMGPDSTLEIRAVEPIWRTRTQIWVRAAPPEEARAGRGVAPGERIVSSGVPAALPGLALRVLGTGRTETGGAAPAPQRPARTPEK